MNNVPPQLHVLNAIDGIAFQLSRAKNIKSDADIIVMIDAIDSYLDVLKKPYSKYKKDTGDSRRD